MASVTAPYADRTHHASVMSSCEFLCLGTTHTWSQIVLCVGCLAPSLASYSLGTRSNTPPPRFWQSTTSKHCQMSPKQKGKTACSWEPLFQPNCATRLSAESCSISSCCLIASWAPQPFCKFPRSKTDVNLTSAPALAKDQMCKNLQKSADPADWWSRHLRG